MKAPLRIFVVRPTGAGPRTDHGGSTSLASRDSSAEYPLRGPVGNRSVSIPRAAGRPDWDGPAAITKTATPKATKSGQNRWPPDPVLRRISQSQNRGPRLTKIAILRAGGIPAQTGLRN